LTILGGVALTLFGVSLIRDSVTQALGAQLRLLIERSTRTKWRSFSAGVLATALIQSSTATILIITGFASRRLIDVAPALAVSLGADVGSTLVAQVFSVGAAGLGPILVLVGMVCSAWLPQGKLKHLGMALVGLGLVLFGLGTVLHAASIIQQSHTLTVVMEALSGDVVMAFLVGLLITWLTQSSLAIVLLIMSFAGAGALELDTAFALVLGAQVGSALTPLIVNLKEKNEAGHIAWGSFVIRLISCIAVLPLIPYLVREAHWFGATVSRRVINFHTVVSLARAIVFLPFVGVIERLLIRYFPYVCDINDPSQTQHLDERDLATPSVALANATREALHLADQVLIMLQEINELYINNQPARLKLLLDRDNTVDRLYDQIKFYLAKLSQESMDEIQARRHVDILMYITNMEHVGDIIVHNLCDLAAKKWRDNLSFSKQGWQEIENYHARICDNFKLAMNVFNSGDPVLAKQLVRRKESIHTESMTATGSHFERLRQGLLESMRSSSLHLDILRDLRSINNSITSVAYSILEVNGALQSRLREDN
jgi:phosphate:Na+ symporter